MVKSTELLRKGNMKIVVNRCYGGFSLSEEAIYALYARRGIRVYTVEDNLGSVYSTVPEEEYKKIRNADKVSGNYVKLNDVFISPYAVDRDDPDLIAVVEELGSERASGDFAELEIVDIPDGIQYEIDENLNRVILTLVDIWNVDRDCETEWG